MKDQRTEEHPHLHVHHSQRAGHNRVTPTQKRRKIISNILFTVLCIIAIAIVTFIIWDKLVGNMGGVKFRSSLF